MFQFIKRTASMVLANSIVVGCDQFIRTHVEEIIRERRQRKQKEQENKR